MKTQSLKAPKFDTWSLSYVDYALVVKESVQSYITSYFNISLKGATKKAYL